MPTREQYDLAFESERQNVYRDIDKFESKIGYAVNRQRLEDAARILACPLKDHAMPLWQHGRVIYAMLRHYLEHNPFISPLCLDIGTAKGFSALTMRWALDDVQRGGAIVSVDILDPEKELRRNTVAECDHLKTLAEILLPWPESQRIMFLKMTGIDFLERTTDRIHFVFVDGKHSFEVVRREGALLANRQQPGDITIFDDMQIPAVCEAVLPLHNTSYEIEVLRANTKRQYGIARKL